MIIMVNEVIIILIRKTETKQCETQQMWPRGLINYETHNDKKQLTQIKYILNNPTNHNIIMVGMINQHKSLSPNPYNMYLTLKHNF